uniref:FAD-linked oxidase C-terminal domain-containing protein n=1 Tax=Persicitalea sp. TaxID=3100273 RepID=UPI0035947018
KREQAIYAGMWGIISNPVDQELIEKNFAKKSVTRRNSGYALDSLVDEERNGDVNLARLIAGSEGTLCFITEAKIGLVDLPPAAVGVVCVHTTSLAEALHANRVAMQHQPKASELVDKYIMDFTKEHHEYSKNRFFLEGDPAALLLVEFWGDREEEVQKLAADFVADLTLENLGYAYPLLFGADAAKAWDIRKAGLGLIRNLPGDTQPVNLIEDCAVAVEDLPNYIADLEKLLARRGLHASYYAHAGAGELHVEPMINLKTSEGKETFREVLTETAALVKKYRGALSGEHGDGRLRGEFIPFMMGQEVYELFRQVKRIWDPNGIFNANKIVDTPPMNESLRYEADAPPPAIETVFDFTREEGILRLTEKCSGSGDCRKTELTGGTMCPSYMATRRGRDTTRARANILRQFYTKSENNGNGIGPASSEMVKEVLDLCLSCKGCKAECPSSVDVGKMKAEFTQQYYDQHGVPFRSRLVADFTKRMKQAALAPWAYNKIFSTPALRRVANKAVGFHPERTMPLLGKQTFRKWFEKRKKEPQEAAEKKGKVFLFCDEFTDYNDSEIGKKLVLLLEGLGYEVLLPKHVESGRTFLSKGLVKEAQKIANKNVQLLQHVISDETPLVGIEPSAILTFRDEYPDLVAPELREAAQKLAKNALLFEEFIAREMEKKNIASSQFSTEEKLIKLHGHCHQKALSSLSVAKQVLS